MGQRLSKRIKVLVVDDEVSARKFLADIVRKDRDVETVLEAENGAIAVELIEKKHPDIIFLDVQMPEVDGFGVIDAIGADRMPLTIFVTAFDEFAIKAFEADAVDYLLKPFTDQRYEQAMARAKAELPSNGFGPNVLALTMQRTEPGALWDWLVIKSSGETRLVLASNIDWIEAAGVYVNLHVGGKELLYRASLSAITERLDPSRFVRIHRSHTVNIRAITKMVSGAHGEVELFLCDDARLILSRNYKADMERRLGQSL